MNISSEKLKTLFTDYKVDPFHRLNILIRRKRSEELRLLLANPQNITLDGFNKDVWVYESQTALNGEPA